MLAIIGGSGLTALAILEGARRRDVNTPYGAPSGALTFGRIAGRDVVFLARHGYGNTIAPHAVNYCANLWALHAEGAGGIVSIASVGGIRADLRPGTLAVPDQIIDYTYGRTCAFPRAADERVMHIDFTRPYAETLRHAILQAGADAGETLVDGGTYAATQGPRLETAAEIDRIERDGGDMVGMTGMPEAALARELALPYAAIAVVVNSAAGRAASAKAISLADIDAVSARAMARVETILKRLVAVHGG